MRRDTSPIFIALADMILCILAVVIVAVAPPKHDDGVKQKAEFLISADWSTDRDADVDLWLRTPTGMVSYGSREVGCAVLDRDSRGFLDGLITLADGSKVKVDSFKETDSIRCIEPGHYDVAAHLYEFRQNSVSVPLNGSDLNLKVRVEVLQLNPTVKVLWAGDVILHHRWDEVNAVSFDVARDGSVTLAEPPLKPLIEDAYHNRTVQ